MYAVASVAGPVLGGYMTEFLSWRWVFLINLPLGLAALWISHRTLIGLPVPQRKPIIDYLGTVLMIVGLTSLLLGITFIGQGYSWHGDQVLGLLVAALIALALFVWHERRSIEPLLPCNVLAGRNCTCLPGLMRWCRFFVRYVLLCGFRKSACGYQKRAFFQSGGGGENTGRRH